MYVAIKNLPIDDWEEINGVTGESGVRIIK